MWTALASLLAILLSSVSWAGPECEQFQTCCIALYGQAPHCDASAYTEEQCAAANTANSARCATVVPVAPVAAECPRFRDCCVSLYGDVPQCDVSAYSEAQCAAANVANAEFCPETAAAPAAPSVPEAPVLGLECTHFEGCCRSMYGAVPHCDASTYSEEQCARANESNEARCGPAKPLAPPPPPQDAGPGSECQHFHQCCAKLGGTPEQCDTSSYSEAQCAQANAANEATCPRDLD